MKQAEAAKFMDMSHTNISRLWRESTGERRWPQRELNSIDKKIIYHIWCDDSEDKQYIIDELFLRKTEITRPAYVWVSKEVRDKIETVRWNV
jgi:hypothetical protein